MSKEKKDLGNLNKKTPLEIAAYIEQINFRERKYATINKVFTLNIKRRKFRLFINYIVELISDKPNNKKGHQVNNVSYEIKNQVDDFFKTPLQKYKNPITTSHELGWDKPSNFKVYKQIYSKNTNDITRFASEYCYLKGKSPFASNKVVTSSSPAKTK